MKIKIPQVTLNANVQDPNVIFVFGSNDAGFHGGGAARFAVRHFGASMRQGKGLQGRSYALPTKNNKLITLSEADIAGEISEFLELARKRTDLTFLVTAVGCGLAGLDVTEIAPQFKDAPENVFVSPKFIDIGSKSLSTKGSQENLLLPKSL